MNIYVASSWRNDNQPSVVRLLRNEGYEVYDFKDSEGFQWKEIDEKWESWTVAEYLDCLKHPYAQRGFKRDMEALKKCDLCIYVTPCGVSASLEMGWAIGHGKPTIAYIPSIKEPDLMIKMADIITSDIQKVIQETRNFNDLLKVLHFNKRARKCWL